MFTALSRGLPSVGDLSYHAPVRLATVAALAANTAALGPPGTLTANANGALAAIDGTAPALGDRVLVRDEVAAANDGVYTVTSLGSAGSRWVLTRAADADTTAELPQGSITYVTGGLVNFGRWFAQSAAMVALGTSAQSWVTLGIKWSRVRLAYYASGTYTRPTDPSYLGTYVRLGGGGGGGAGAAAAAASQHAMGSGGGSGAWAESFIGYGQMPATVAVTIGAFGAAGVGAAAAGGGGQSSFGTLLVANGGSPGATLASSAAVFRVGLGGQGGLAAGGVGDYFYGGNPGGMAYGGGTSAGGGNGAAGVFGGGGRGAAVNGTASNSGVGADANSGAGGGGGASGGGGAAANGGVGGAGFALLEEFYSS